ncbi:MAG: hypothetical protein JW845_02770 [Dehalococcoidales bacterium]|nr:hypothetical protein [Dehalococcoidales bacterium]
MKRILIALLLISFLLFAACPQQDTPAYPVYPDALGRTAYGFFPSPTEATVQGIFDIYEAMGRHADVALLQQNIPWEEFVDSVQTNSKTIIDIGNQYTLSHENGLEVIFVVDPLNGLNRSEFYNLPAGWEASFGNPDIRAAFTNFVISIVRMYHPSYLGLASEINTYHDTHPDDFEYYLSLYREVYDQVKAEAPDTKIFVTFQWEEMNNLIPGVARGEPYEVNWFQIEQFEPKLDIWAISSYPFIIFTSGKDIPADYYSSLLTRTLKPIAVAEGGYSSEDVMSFSGSTQGQVDYLNAIHAQLGGERLAFWIYLLLADFDMESYVAVMTEQGHAHDAPTLGIFEAVGLCESDYTPKPALATWDSFRSGD